MFFSRKKNKIEKLSKFNGNNETLIEELKKNGIIEQDILGAIRKVPREFFVKQQFIQQAYENIPLPIDCGQTISQPYVVAYMISHLNLKNTDKVLEIGTGTGYLTAILSHLCNEVCTIEIYSELLNKAKQRIAKLNLKNIFFKLGNGVEGWKNNILFDAIIISAAAEAAPAKLLKNLKDHGCLIMPQKKPLGNQILLLIKRKNKTYSEEELCDVKFVPLLNRNIE